MHKHDEGVPNLCFKHEMITVVLLDFHQLVTLK